MNDDTISRRAAIKAICEHGTELERRGITVLAVANHKQVTVDLLENLPAAERRGRWEDIEHAPNGLLYVTCSVCGKRQTVEFMSYCGNCGSFNGEGEENAELQR